jgi:hypothetical protein
VSKLSSELADIATLHAVHGTDALLAALRWAVEFRRWRAADVRSILAASGAAPTPRPGRAWVRPHPGRAQRSSARCVGTIRDERNEFTRSFAV